MYIWIVVEESALEKEVVKVPLDRFLINSRTTVLFIGLYRGQILGYC